MIFSAGYNYEFRSIFSSRASFDCGECPCLFPHRVVLRHGFAGLPILDGPCVACSRGALRGRTLLFQYGYFGGSLRAFLSPFPS